MEECVNIKRLISINAELKLKFYVSADDASERNMSIC